MSLEVIISEFQTRAAGLNPLGASLKIVLGNDAIFIDGKGEKNVVSNSNEAADCTITTTLETLMALKSGELNPIQAMAEQAITIEGDMMVAMQLQGLM